MINGANAGMRIKVIKSDGSLEDYLHTKVIGTLSTALAESGNPDIFAAEELSEVGTYFLYNKKTRTVTSSEIFSIIKAVLSSTSYENAAIALSEYHFERKLKRYRTEVVAVNIQHLADAESLCHSQSHHQKSHWSKSRIANDLETNDNIPRQTARMIASMVEEKVFSMGLTLVPASLIKQIVLRDAASVLRAHQQLQTIS